METPPLRTFLFVLTFLAIFGVLVGTIPSEFVEASKEYKKQSVPEYFESLDITSFNQTIVKNITEQWYSKTYYFGGHDFQLIAYNDNGGKLVHKHYHWFWFIPVGHHPMEWHDKNGKRVDIPLAETRGINKQILDSSWDNSTNTAKFTLKCKHVTIQAFFGYNTTKYNSPSEAWENYEISILFTIGLDQIGMGWNTWSLLTGILFFQIPEINPVLNLIIAVPIWICIAWLTIAFAIAIIKALPLT